MNNKHTIKQKNFLETAKYDAVNFNFPENNINYNLFIELRDTLLDLEFADNNIRYTIPYFKYILSNINCLIYGTSSFNLSDHKIMRKRDIIKKQNFLLDPNIFDNYNKYLETAKYDTVNINFPIHNSNYNLFINLRNSLLTLEITDKNIRYAIPYFKYLMSYINCLLYDVKFSDRNSLFIPNNIKIMSDRTIEKKYKRINKKVPSYDDLYEEESDNL